MAVVYLPGSRPAVQPTSWISVSRMGRQGRPLSRPRRRRNEHPPAIYAYSEMVLSRHSQQSCPHRRARDSTVTDQATTGRPPGGKPGACRAIGGRPGGIRPARGEHCVGRSTPHVNPDPGSGVGPWSLVRYCRLRGRCGWAGARLHRRRSTWLCPQGGAAALRRLRPLHAYGMPAQTHADALGLSLSLP